MSDDKFCIVYNNEDDKAFGLAGMAVTMASLDAFDRIAEVWLDAEGPMVSFSNDYYFAGNPSVSPKASWNNLLRNFHLTTSMVVGNLMARSLVRLGRELPEDVLSEVRDIVREEGRDSCALEDEETDVLFNRSMREANRLFRNPRLAPAVRELASMLSRRRRLSGRELEEELMMLRL